MPRVLSVALSVAVLGFLPLSCANVPWSDYWTFEPEHLVYRKEAKILFSGKGAHSGPGTARAVLARTEWRGKSIPDPALYFAPIATEAQALELCELKLWGTRVQSEEQFQKILEAYGRIGFEVAEPDSREECRRGADERVYDSRSERSGEGFEVALTAFVLPDGMGASAKLARFRYRVSRGGKVEVLEETPYLTGPYLNWQVATVAGRGPETDESRAKREEFYRQNQARYAKRATLIEAIYEIAKGSLPPGRPGLKAKDGAADK